MRGHIKEKQKQANRKRSKLDQLYKKYRLAKAEVQAADKLLADAERRAKAAHENLKKTSEAVKQELRTVALRDIL